MGDRPDGGVQRRRLRDRAPVSALWAAVARDRDLLRPEVTDDEVSAILRASSPSIGFYGGTIALAVVAPRLAAFAYLVIAVVAVLRVRGDETVVEPEPS